MEYYSWGDFVLDLLKTYEYVAVWLEGSALVLILILDYFEFRRQGRERAKREKERIEERSQQDQDREAQAEQQRTLADVLRRQIHAERVAWIFQTMRKFVFFLSDSIRDGHFEVGQRFEHSRGDHAEPEILEVFGNIYDAYYLAILINEPLARYIKERVSEAAALQEVKDHNELTQRLEVFWRNWDGERMAEAIRTLS